MSSLSSQTKVVWRVRIFDTDDALVHESECESEDSATDTLQSLVSWYVNCTDTYHYGEMTKVCYPLYI